MGRDSGSLLLFVRHARADPSHPLGDSARGLTSDGRDHFRLHAEGLAGLFGLKGVVTSPLVRAVQTAELLALSQGVARVEVRGDLVPHGRAADRIAALARELGPGFALVGHNPSLAHAAADLLELRSLPFKLRKGAVLALRKQGKGYAFAWFALPGEPLVRELPKQD